ncbi:hypothetical protein UT300012_09550 [Paraclostridium bifermentans]
MLVYFIVLRTNEFCTNIINKLNITDINKPINQGRFQYKTIEISLKKWYSIKRKSKKNVVIIYKINFKIEI